MDIYRLKTEKWAELALGLWRWSKSIDCNGRFKRRYRRRRIAGYCRKWRAASPRIIKLWNDVDFAAKEAIEKADRSLLSIVDYDLNGEMEPYLLHYRVVVDWHIQNHALAKIVLVASLLPIWA